LLAPGRIGKLELRNRMIVAAMGVSLAEEDGTCGERLIAYHEAQARGGVGLIVTGVSGVAWPVGAVMPNQCGISEEGFIPGLERLTGAVHAHGAKIAAQLHHGGLVAVHAAQTGHPLWAPSLPGAFKGDFLDAFLPEELAAFAGAAVPSVKVLTHADIQQAIQQFAQAAERARAAGFDGVEIHGGHGYLLSSFFSPATNKRSDEYGGSLENRARLMLEVVRATRRAVGPDFPMWCKLVSREVGKDPGIKLEDAQRLAVLLEEAGVDALAVSAYHDTGQGKLHSGSNIPHEPECNVPAAAAIKARVRVPIIAAGRIELDRADVRMTEGAFDFLALGRKLLADPSLPNKLAAGRTEDIRPCIYCYTCVSAAYVRQQVRCAVRPETGYEVSLGSPQTLRLPRAGRPIVVVGGGPAGLEVARRLDCYGHRVILLESGADVGGTLRLASLAYAPNEELLEWLRRQIASSDVDVRVGSRGTPDGIRALEPDEVVVATGAIREPPPIRGVELDHVLSGEDLRHLLLGESSDSLRSKTGVTTRLLTRLGAATGLNANLEFVRNATRRWMPLGSRIAIIGGELVGLELAEFLTERGRAVTVIEEGAKCGRGLTPVRRMRLLSELREHAVALHAGVHEVSIERKSVAFTDSVGQIHRVPADHVIIARGARPDSSLANELRECGLKVRAIGDCAEIGYIEGAMRSAAQAAVAINQRRSLDA